MSAHKRPCAILVADNAMGAAFRGFFGRSAWHMSLGCGEFDISVEVDADLIIGSGRNDPGVYTYAHEILRPYQHSHERAIVALDCEWEGSPGKTQIIANISSSLVSSGWPSEQVRVIVIEPELEAWIWQDKPHVANALRYRESKPLRTLLAEEQHWLADHPKPARPKEAFEWVLRQTRRPYSSAIFEEICRNVSTRGCVDPAFAELRVTLQQWFPEAADETL